CLSLWEVDDAATALLMERFYQNLLGQREGLKAALPKAEALAEAKRWLRELPRAEVLKRVARLSAGVARGKGRPALPRLPETPGGPDDKEPPYAHPYFCAGFVLVGDAQREAIREGEQALGNALRHVPCLAGSALTAVAGL